MAVLVCIPTNGVRGFPFLHTKLSIRKTTSWMLSLLVITVILWSLNRGVLLYVQQLREKQTNKKPRSVASAKLVLCYKLLLLLLSRFSRVRLCATPDGSPPGSLPWDSPGKNTGVGCHFLLQCTKVKSESELTQSCPTLATPWTAAYQAPPPMGLSRQKYWSGVPLPSPSYKLLHLGLFQATTLNIIE